MDLNLGEFLRNSGGALVEACAQTPLGRLLGLGVGERQSSSAGERAEDGERHAGVQRRTRGWRRGGGAKQASKSFPCQVQLHTGRRDAAWHHTLVAVGDKVWGIPLILPVAKLYEFGLYVDRSQARDSKLRRAPLPEGPPSVPFFRELTLSDDVDWTLVVRAARNLPIRLLRSEYTRILRKRIRSVGGSVDDPALHTLLQLFREEALPSSVRQGGSLRQGTTLVFTMAGDGTLEAQAGQVSLGRVQSGPLCAAVLDLYLGLSPVSRKAKLAAGESLLRLLKGGDLSQPTCLSDSLACRL